MHHIIKSYTNWQQLTSYHMVFIIYIILFLSVQINGQRLEIKRNVDSVNSDQSQSLYVPLKKVNVEATINSFAADVTITQVFRNDENTPIEAVYCFPIEEQAAVYSFVARINDREIIAQLKEKKQAQKEYSEALRNNHGAYLLEQDEKSQDNFIINIGALPPSTECTITIKYVSELDLVDGYFIRFVIPTTIAPRYSFEQGGISSPAGTTSKYVQKSPYTIEFHCYIKKITGKTGQLIDRISSSSHPIKVDFKQQDAYLVTFGQENTHLDRDILINIELAEKQVNTILTVESNAVMAVFMPTDEDCRRARNNEQTNEFIFVVDCSGSMMDENKIGLTREAVMLFLKSLPRNSQFNIIRFGSNYETLFSEITVVYNEANLRQAKQMVSQMQADMGGTELLAPLKWLKEHSPVKSRSRQIFLLTDGEISDVSTVLDLCQSMASSTRIFSFGLGMSPSRALVKGLARATNGRFVFIPPNSRVDVYVNEQLHRALQTSITNIQVKWNFGEIKVRIAPTRLPPVYANDRLIIYGLIDKNSTLPLDINLAVELYTEENHHRLGGARIEQISNKDNKGSIARLAAKALVLELQHSRQTSRGSLQSRLQDETNSEEKTIESEEIKKKRIIELSLNYKILTPYTAFVGIEKRIDGNNIDMILREVPIQISVDDQHLIRTQSSIVTSTDKRLRSSSLDSFDIDKTKAKQIFDEIVFRYIDEAEAKQMLNELVFRYIHEIGLKRIFYDIDFSYIDKTNLKRILPHIVFFCIHEAKGKEIFHDIVLSYIDKTKGKRILDDIVLSYIDETEGERTLPDMIFSFMGETKEKRILRDLLSRKVGINEAKRIYSDIVLHYIDETEAKQMLSSLVLRSIQETEAKRIFYKILHYIDETEVKRMLSSLVLRSIHEIGPKPIFYDIVLSYIDKTKGKRILSDLLSRNIDSIEADRIFSDIFLRYIDETEANQILSRLVLRSIQETDAKRIFYDILHYIDETGVKGILSSLVLRSIQETEVKRIFYDILHYIDETEVKQILSSLVLQSMDKTDL